MWRALPSAIIKIRKKMQNKASLRQQLLARRRALDSGFINVNSKLMADRLTNLPEYQRAKTVMLFLSMPNEPQTDDVIKHALALGKKVAVPHMRKEYGIMDAALIDNLDDLVTGRLGLRVPNPDKLQLISPDKLDLIVVPGVVFDAAGNRIGMGAGYYDRFLRSALQAMLIGLAWDFQIVDAVPHEPHDVTLDQLLTEKRHIMCNRGKA